MDMDLNKVALIIVDMQNDFVHDDGYFGRMAEKIGFTTKASIDMNCLKAPIPYIKRLADIMRKARRPIVYLQCVLEPDYADAGFPTDHLPQAKEMQFLVKETWGAQICEELTPQKGDYVVTKRTYGGFSYTHLDLLLRNLDIKTLVMTGVGTNVCVETTIREAVALGYKVIIVSDATGTSSWELHRSSLNALGFAFGKVKSTEEVIDLFEGRM